MTPEDEIKDKLNQQLVTECKNQDLGKIKELIANGAQANYAEKSGEAFNKGSVLQFAVSGLKNRNDYEIWKEIILLLLKNGADPNERIEDYDWRGCGEMQSIFNFMSNKIDEPDSDLLQAFLKAGMSPNLQRVVDLNSMRTSGIAKSNLIHDFSRTGNVDCIFVLLEMGADVDIYATEKMTNERGIKHNTLKTALHYAASYDHLEVCILLLAKGADINKTHHFIENELNEEIQNSNVTDNPRDEDYIKPWENFPIECTALHLALKNNHYDLAKFLLAAGANQEIPYKRGDNEISTFDLFLSGEKSIIEKEEALKNALSGKMSLELLINSMTESVDTIYSYLRVIQDSGWELDKYNFCSILESVKLIVE